jgi:hypothetical protein
VQAASTPAKSVSKLPLNITLAALDPADEKHITQSAVLSKKMSIPLI